MPSTNGHGPKRAILYARVSTDEQARSGYSLAQQLKALRAYAAQEGYEILKEVSDPGQSGAYLERPGLDRIRELVSAGGVSLVLAQDADRVSREPWHFEYLKLLFDDFGTELKTLDDGADGSPMGEFVSYIRRGVAKLERTEIAKRSLRGRAQKAAEGKIVGSHRPRYGFRFNAARAGYEIHEEQMAVVRRLFRMVGEEGLTLYGTRKVLERDGVRSPGGKKLWHQGYMRKMILDDVYRPHTVEELRSVLSPKATATLNPDKLYGVAYYGRVTQSKRKVSADRFSYKTSVKPREEWIAIPVPHGGIPQQWVDRAREAIRNNRRPSAAALRFWELSGGVMRCASCRRAMQTTSIPMSSGKVHHYYRCPKRVRDGKEGCENAKNRRALQVEQEVWEEVSALLKDPERLRVGLEAMIEEKRKRLRGNPEREMAVWFKKLSELDAERRGYLRLAARGSITDRELDEVLYELEDARLIAQRELAKLRDAQEELDALEQDAETLLASYEEATPGYLDSLDPEERHHIYRLMRLEVLMKPDGSLEARGDIPLDVSKLSTTSTRSA